MHHCTLEEVTLHDFSGCLSGVFGLLGVCVVWFRLSGSFARFVLLDTALVSWHHDVLEYLMLFWTRQLIPLLVPLFIFVCVECLECFLIQCRFIIFPCFCLFIHREVAAEFGIGVVENLNDFLDCCNQTI